MEGWSNGREALEGFFNTPPLHHPNSAPLIFRVIRAKSSGVGHEIKLSGGEITILKAIGLTGTAMAGKFLLDRMEEGEAGRNPSAPPRLLCNGEVPSSTGKHLVPGKQEP